MKEVMYFFRITKNISNMMKKVIEFVILPNLYIIKAEITFIWVTRDC